MTYLLAEMYGIEINNEVPKDDEWKLLTISDRQATASSVILISFISYCVSISFNSLVPINEINMNTSLQPRASIRVDSKQPATLVSLVAWLLRIPEMVAVA